jgi:transketolase
MSIKISHKNKLAEIAREIRINIIQMLAIAGSGHTGGSLGMTDIFTYLYFKQLKNQPKNPGWEDRDRLILSIGHIAPVLYATLAQAGYFEKYELNTLRKLGSRLQGHPGKDHNLPGIEISSGSLGQGLSIAVGLALGARMDQKDWKVYSIHGDGELQEGSIWEAAMSASHYKLDNLIAIVDRNHLQIDGKTRDVMEIEPLDKKWESFGWNVFHCDAHNFNSIEKAFAEAHTNFKKPSVIIAQSTMGKGIPEIENNHKWHGKAPSKSEAERFIKQLKTKIK